MADRPYLTSAEAATYCGFKTIGGIQQAVRRGKLKPAGRRGGTGTYVFAREDLDSFLTGGLQPHERLFVPPEVNEAARLSAGTAGLSGASTSASARPKRAAAGSVSGASLGSAPAGAPAVVPAAASTRAAGDGPSSAGPGRSSVPLRGAPAPATPKPAPRPAVQPPGPGANRPAAKRGSKTAPDDPVARIIQALSGTPEDRAKPARRAKPRKHAKPEDRSKSEDLAKPAKRGGPASRNN